MDQDNRGRFVKGGNTGSKNPNWKGDNAKYGTKHDWARRNFGTPQTCEHCEAINMGSRKHHWANISGDYKRVRPDWLRLCSKCHAKYDERTACLRPFVEQKIRVKTKRNKTGYKNVRITPYGKYRSYITVGHRKQKNLGSYDTPEQAYEAYKKEALRLYGTY